MPGRRSRSADKLRRVEPRGTRALHCTCLYRQSRHTVLYEVSDHAPRLPVDAEILLLTPSTRTCTHVCRVTCAHMHIYTDMHTTQCTYTHTHAHVCSDICMHMCTQITPILKCTHTNHVHMHAHLCTHMSSMNTHAHTVPCRAPHSSQ